MRVEIVSQARPGKPVNEDVAVFIGSAAWVLDGASVPQLLREDRAPDARWYVEHLSAALDGALRDEDEQPLERVVAAAIERVVAEGHAAFGTVAHWPSSTLTVVRRRGAQLEYLILGDSPLLIAMGEVVRLVTDSRLRLVGQDVRRRIHAGLAEGYGYDSWQHSALVEQLVLQERGVRNRDGGYWIASDDPSAAAQGVAGVLAIDGPAPIGAVALLTDGMSRSIEPLGLFAGPAELMKVVRGPGGPDAALRAVRAAEAQDPSGQHFPRTTASDDCTCLVWTFG